MTVRFAPAFALTIACIAGAAREARAADVTGIRQIPDEYETTSGHGLAMNNGGTAANDPFSAIRENPALLAASKQYTVNGGYHWPTVGRDYYQAGIVDSKSSSVAVGISYTGFTDDYQYPVYDQKSGVRNNSVSQYDSPIMRRGVVGVAQGFGNLMVGAGATYVEAHTFQDSDQHAAGQDTIKGFGMNLGAALALSPEWSLGASVENASNKQIKEYEPMTYRAGVAYLFTQGIMAYVDFRQRERVQEFEGTISEPSLDPGQPRQIIREGISTPEQMVLGSVTAQVQEYLKLVGSYGQSMSDDRRSLAGGAALVNKNFSLSYTMARPYMKSSASHQAITLSLEMAI